MTFTEAIERANATQHESEASLIRRTRFAGPLQELKALQKAWPKQQAALQRRLDAVSARLVQAERVGVHQDDCFQLVAFEERELTGGRGTPRAGILETIASEIAMAIQQMEGFSEEEVPLRALWLPWLTAPAKIRDCIARCEQVLAIMERKVADNGPLQTLVEQVAERKAGSQAVA